MQLLEKEQLLKVNLWDLYWQFIQSIQAIYKAELQKKIPGEEIIAELGVTGCFFGPNGEAVGDHPELEEIYFKIEGRQKSVRLAISLANVQKTQLQLVVGDDETYYYPKDENFSLSMLFQEEFVQVATDWLRRSWLNEFGNDNFQQNY